VLLETHNVTGTPGPPPREREADRDGARRRARRDLAAQIADLERRLTALTVDGFAAAGRAGGAAGPAGAGAERAGAGAAAATPPGAGPRLLSLGDLEALRDELAGRVRAARGAVVRRADEHEFHRRRLEDMLARPRAYKWHRVARAQVGEPGCGVWQVRPRLGLIGMLAGWWHVKLSSGCPRATAPRSGGAPRARARRAGTIPAWAAAAASA